MRGITTCEDVPMTTRALDLPDTSGLKVDDAKDELRKVTGKPYRFENFESDDLFIARDKSGHVRSYIKCSNKDVPNPPCRHRFKLMNGIQVTIDLLYSRQRLYDWQKLEKQSADIILGFTHTAENDPVNIQSSSNRSK